MMPSLLLQLQLRDCSDEHPEILASLINESTSGNSSSSSSSEAAEGSSGLVTLVQQAASDDDGDDDCDAEVTVSDR
jgi:hypothetical protein